MTDDLNRVVEAGDWIGYKGSYSTRIETGVVVNATNSGNPRILKYNSYNNTFSERPKAITKGFIKLDRPDVVTPFDEL